MAITEEDISKFDSIFAINPLQQIKSTATGAIQGVFLDWADETGAYLASSLKSGDLSQQAYDEALRELRSFDAQQLEANPLAYFTGKIGGSILASLIPASWIARYAKTVKQLIPALSAEGAVIGGLTGAGSAEEGESRVDRAISGAVQGAVMNPVFYAGVNYSKKPFGWLFNKAKDAFRTKFADLPSQELGSVITKMATDAKVTPDEIIQAVIDGKIPAETNRATTELAMLVGKKGEETSQIISEAAERRIKIGREKTKETLQADLFPSEDSNIPREMERRKGLAGDKVSKLYKDAFGEGELIDEGSPILGELQDIFKRFPDQARELKKAILADRGVAPFFKFKKVENEQTGEIEEIVEWATTPTVEEVEIVRRSLKDLTAPVFEGGSKSSIIRGAAREKERAFREILNDTYPELKRARQEAADVFRAYGGTKDFGAFDKGRKALTKSPDDIELEFEDIVSRGLPDEISAYRAGIMSKLKFSLNTPRVGSTIDNLADEATNAGKILSIVYPEDKFDEILRILDNTRASQLLGKKQFQQSITGDILGGRGKEAGTASGLFTMGRAMSGDQLAVAQLAINFMKTNLSDGSLSKEEMARFARFLVEEDPVKVKRIFDSIYDEEALAKKIKSIIRQNATLSGAATELLATPEGKVQALEQVPEIPTAIFNLAKTIKPNTKEKILEATSSRP
tara:strand:- start:51 stop:2111 length:2061 start_codon:yes stop_codon:yes gene_type:complete